MLEYIFNEYHYLILIHGIAAFITEGLIYLYLISSN